MFPPVDDGVLKANPDFAVLYGKLTNVVLDGDGCTKDDPAARERRRVREVRGFEETGLGLMLMVIAGA